MKVDVRFDDNTSKSYQLSLQSTKTKSSLQKYRHTTALLCELRRRIAADRNVAPINQTLSFASPLADFTELFSASVFPQLLCSKRVRNAAEAIEIRSWSDDVYQLKVDRTDTVLDVKFLLAQTLNTRPEFIHFVVNFDKRVLNNSDTVETSELLSSNPDNVTHYWLEMPQEDGSFIVRSDPQLWKITEKTQSVAHYFRHACKQFPDNNHLGVRSFNADGSRGDYQYLKYTSMQTRVNNMAAGFRAIGISPGQETRLGICSANRPEWVMVDYAGHTQSMVTVPLYDTLSKNAIEYIVNHAGVNVVVVDTQTLPQVVKAQASCPTLKRIILMDDYPPERKWADENRNAGFTHRMSQVEKLGAANPVADILPKPSDFCTICYTSGTTGDPKGAMITHENFMSVVETYLVRLDRYFKDQEDHGVLSFLPLAHIYEKLVEMLCLGYGSRISYWQGDKLLLADDLVAAKPSFFAGVPRIYQKFQDKVMLGVSQSNFIRRFLFNKAYEAKAHALKNRKPPPALWEKLVFSKVKANFGGAIIGAGSGSAPLSSATAEFIRTVFADHLSEGYGLTETCAAGTGTDPDDSSTNGHVGAVVPCVEMKLMDVEDMNYLTSDEPCPRGEIWFRGPSIFQGYYKNPEATEPVLMKDGWFATGDVGKWRMDGKLQIIDRKKNIFKLAQGEYIRPEYIENVYKMSTLVGNIFAHGNSDQTYLVAIIWPDPEAIVPWAEANGLKSLATDFNELIKHPKTVQAIRADMDKVASREGLQGFEKVKRIQLVPEDFTVESGLLTSTMKLKRAYARTVFAKEIAEMYQLAAKSKL